MDHFIPILLVIGSAYLGLGAVFAVCFVLIGVSRIDPVASGAPVSFRLLLFPGAAALWPLLLARWLRRAPPPPPAHPARERIERTRMMLAGPAAYWAAVLLAWFVLVIASRSGASP